MPKSANSVTEHGTFMTFSSHLHHSFFCSITYTYITYFVSLNILFLLFGNFIQCTPSHSLPFLCPAALALACLSLLFFSLCYGLLQIPLDIFCLLATRKAFPQQSSYVRSNFSATPRYTYKLTKLDVSNR